MYGYKKAQNGNTYVIITLFIPSDSLTNLNRNNISNPNFASYRCSKAKVINIEDENGYKYNQAHSCFCGKFNKLKYTTKKFVETSFDSNLENERSSGIHFFLTEKVANNYFSSKPENGVKYTYWENGSIYTIYNYKNLLYIIIKII